VPISLLTDAVCAARSQRLFTTNMFNRFEKEVAMSKKENVRWGWLKLMYIYTIIGAGGVGLGIVIMPDVMRSIFSWPSQDPIVLGVVGSVYIAFGLLSILGLRSPLKFAPVLLLQLSYKVVWFIGVLLPILFSGKFQTYAIMYVVIFATYIIGDLIAIPFWYVLGKEGEENAIRPGLPL
jgi:hypothetical protein